METTYREDLDGRGCDHVHCPGHHSDDPIYFSPKCHPRRGVVVSYHKGILRILCVKCAAIIGNIAVACRHSLPEILT